MPPEIYIDRKLVANLPDQDGIHQTEIGPISVNLSGINPDKKVQEIELEGEGINGKRVIQLSKQGKGSQIIGAEQVGLVKRQKKLSVKLIEAPIVKTEISFKFFSDKRRALKTSVPNPFWVKK